MGGKQQPFTVKRVRGVRYAYGLKSRYERLRGRGLLTAVEMAAQLGVSTRAIHDWGRAGLLERESYGHSSRCLYFPTSKILVKKGQGGRRPSPPTFITAPSATQEIV